MWVLGPKLGPLEEKPMLLTSELHSNLQHCSVMHDSITFILTYCSDSLYSRIPVHICRAMEMYSPHFPQSWELLKG